MAIRKGMDVNAIVDGTSTDGKSDALGIMAVVPMSASGVAPASGVRTSGSDGVSNVQGQTVSDGTNQSNYLMIWNYLFNGTTWDRQKKANATSRIVSAAATTNATNAKASAGDVFSIEATNTTAALKYLKLYNKATAPTVGTDTPFLTIPLQPSNAPTLRTFPNGLYLSAGISYALTGAAADADTTALAAGDVVGVNIAYA